jgi:membrane-bound metal-dependent hydrolase YbcI (DUF457 family)
MFIGHFAVGFAAKKAAPRTSLAVLIGAAAWPDVVWSACVLAGWERVRIEPGNTAVTPLAFDHYPFSHSLVADIGWATALATGYFAVTRYRRGAIWVWLGVMSHWLLDFLSHRPDVPVLISGGLRVGLGLWNSIPATLVVEGGLFATAVGLYATTFRATGRAGTYGLWTFVVVLVSLYLASVFGPPPPNVTAVAVSDLAGIVLILWAWRVDRHRVREGRDRNVAPTGVC